MVENLALDQKIIEFKTRQPEQLASLMVGKRPGAVAFYGEPFERLTTGIGVLSNVIGQLDDDLHGFSIAGPWPKNGSVTG